MREAWDARENRSGYTQGGRLMVHRNAVSKTGKGRGRMRRFPVVVTIPDPMLIEKAKEIIESGHGYTRIITVSPWEILVK